MSESVPESGTVPESEADSSTLEQLSEALRVAIEAMLKALWALLLVLMILAARALQAIFVLARPGAYVACVVAAGYTSVALFGTVLVQYGGDFPAMLLALSAVVIVPASLIVLAENYGVWGIMLAVAVLEFLAHLGLQRAPPLVLALIPVLALAGTTFYFLTRAEQVEQTEETESQKGAENEPEKRVECAVVDRDNEFDHLHSDAEL